MSDNKTNNKGGRSIVAVIGVIVMMILAYFGGDSVLNLFSAQSKEVNSEATSLENISIVKGAECISSIDINEDVLRVYYFDVGQADSILIVNKGQTMLIDAGNNGDRKISS